MALPTGNLVSHYDSSDTDNIFTTYDGGGSHSGTPSDGSAVEVWDDEGDGASDQALIWPNTASQAPNWRSTTPLMLNPCLDFDGSVDMLQFYDQTGSTAKTLDFLIANNAFTVIMAFYAESITATSNNAWQNHCLIGDNDGFWGIFLKKQGANFKVQCFNYDGNSDSVDLTINENQSYVITYRHDSGGTIYGGLDGGSESSTASGNTQSLTSAVFIGDTGLSTLFNGRIGEFAVWDIALVGSNLTDANDHFVSKWITGVSNDRFWPYRHVRQRRHRYAGGFFGR